MNQNELFSMFPSTCALIDRVLLIPPDEFPKLEGQAIEDCRVFILVIAGELELSIDRKPYVMRSSSLLDLVEGVVVNIQKGSPSCKAFCLLPNDLFATESLKTLKPGPDNYFLERLHFPILHISLEECVVLERQMRLLEDSLRSTEHHYRRDLVLSYFRSFMLELGNIMLKHADGMNEVSASFNNNEMMAMSFLKLVWKYFKQEHSVDFYADQLCVSSKYLSRIVRDLMGKTPHAIVCEELVHYAMALLEDGRMPVSQVSDILCFSDQASFGKFFKKHTGLSPLGYRKVLREH